MLQRIALLIVCAALGCGLGACSRTAVPKNAVLFSTPYPLEQFTPRIANAGDVDADGFEDLIIGATCRFGGPPTTPTIVYSPKTEARLLTLTTPLEPTSTFEVSGAGDTNGDGHADLLVADVADPARFHAGRVWLFSGLDGSILAEWADPQPEDGFGAFVCGVGDLDGDGNDDVLIGASQNCLRGEPREPVATGPGYANVYSGKSASLLFTVRGVALGHALGGTACALGDVDDDSRPDLAIGSFWQSEMDCALIVSGTDGHVIRRIEPIDTGGHGVSGLFRMRDRDGDGLDDCGMAVGFHAIVFSSKTGAALFESPELEYSPSWFADVDLDGVDDFLTHGFGTRPTFIDEDIGNDLTFYSGRTGLQLARIFLNHTSFTDELVPIGDLDGDRVSDLLLAHGSVYVLSTGRLSR